MNVPQEQDSLTDSTLFPVNGIEVPADKLRSYRARILASHLASEVTVGFKLDGCYRSEGDRGGEVEAVCFTAKANIPQRPVYPILVEESFLVEFTSNELPPQLSARRRDFPFVPHLNLTGLNEPKSPCLYEGDIDELNSVWAPAFLTSRLRWWLEKNSRGELHQPSQPLEPFITNSGLTLLIPSVHESQETEAVWSIACGCVLPDRLVLVTGEGRATDETRRSVLTFNLPEVSHGVIHYAPKNLLELEALLKALKFNLFEELKLRFQQTLRVEDKSTVGTILLFRLPKRRSHDAAPESVEHFAVECFIKSSDQMQPVSLVNLGQKLGFLDSADQKELSELIKRATREGDLFVPRFAPLLDREAAKDVVLCVASVIPSLTRDQAAMISGQPAPCFQEVLLVGAGAIGSQVAGILARQGWGNWTVVDKDYIASHNLTRHAFIGDTHLGFSKAQLLSAHITESFGGQSTSIPVNVLRSGSKRAELDQAAASASLIVDASASVSVSRYLAHQVVSSARRVSIFCEPSGKDLVVLAEDVTRKTPLDSLESQYYRSLYREAKLNNHLSKEGQYRYGRSCSDLTAVIKPEYLAVHAAVAANFLKQSQDDADARILIWRLEEHTLESRLIEVRTYETLFREIGTWTIVFDLALLERLHILRAADLPNETCGIVVGYQDTLRHRLYLTDILDPPSDTLKEPHGCERGIEQLLETTELITRSTGGQVTYVGEWHSHPIGVPSSPSSHDIEQFSWLRGLLHREGRIALQLIIGADELGILFQAPEGDFGCCSLEHGLLDGSVIGTMRGS